MIKTENQSTVLLITIAFIFSIALRLIWVEQFSTVEEFKFNDQFMINTNDGYYYAEGARDILSGEYQENSLSPIHTATAQLTAFVAMLLPFSFESIILYLPIVLSSLIVIPIILIGRSFLMQEAGFIAALLASITWSYYNRTMVGYFDTDMLNIVLPTLLLWSLVWALKTREDKYILLSGLEIIAYRWWYPQSYSLEFAYFALMVLYTAFLLYKKRDITYELKLLSVFLFAMVNLPAMVRLILVLGFYIGFKKEIALKHLYILFVLSLIVFIATGGINPILAQLQGYVFSQSVEKTSDGIALHFFSVIQTVREAGQIPFETFANRISGHTLTFVLSFIGYLWLVYRYPLMFVALPMLGLGFLALSGGLRFTVYAVPIMALGAGFFIVELSRWLSSQLINNKVAFVARYVFMALFSIGVLYPNIIHIIEYKVPTVFTKQEVEVLDKLKSVADREDYVVAWWDYGYPIRYYSDVKTLIDGGKHKGDVNFPVSYILTSPQELSARLARLDVEYTEKRFALKDNQTWAKSNIEQMTLDYGFKDTNQFLQQLETINELPQKTRDVYLYLPNRMMGIYPTVALFSNLDLMSGTQSARPFFYQTSSFKDSTTSLDLGNGIVLFKNNGTLQVGDKKIALGNFIVTEYDASGKLQKQKQTINSDSPVHIIFMKNYNQFLVLDTKSYNSLYIQLFVLENYNESLFEPVIFDPLAKIYKLKI